MESSIFFLASAYTVGRDYVMQWPTGLLAYSVSIGEMGCARGKGGCQNTGDWMSCKKLDEKIFNKKFDKKFDQKFLHILVRFFIKNFLFQVAKKS